MRRGPDTGRVFNLTKDEIRVGRGAKNDIIIHDNEVSRDHLKLTRTGAGFELENLTAAHATFVNGHPVEDVWSLETDCIIELGDSITMEYHPGEPPAHLPPPIELGQTEAIPLATRELAYLVVSIGTNDEPAIYPLEADEVKIGRSMTNDIVIVEPEMSRDHLRLTLGGAHYRVEDLGSTNGTMLNGELIHEPHALKPGDVIQIGTMVELRYTNKPDTLRSHMKTDTLKPLSVAPTSMLTSTGKRKTSPSEVPDLAKARPSSAEPSASAEPTSALENAILVTYARENWELIVSPLVEHLHAAEIDTWVDQHLLPNGEDWRAATEQARLECWLLLVVVSEAAMNSDSVKRSWRHFHNREKPILLLIHEMVDGLPIGADKLPRVQFNPAAPALAFSQLATEIKRQKLLREKS